MTDTAKNLTNKLMQKYPESGEFNTAVPGLKCYRKNHTTQVGHCFYSPMALLILQGEKQVLIGSEEYTYHAGDCLISSIEMPTAGRIVKASEKEPFITVALNFDESILSSLAYEVPPTPFEQKAEKGVGIIKADDRLLSAFERLLDLEDSKNDLKVMAPMILREIHYLLLTSELGSLLRSVSVKDTHNNQISKAISFMKDNFRNPLKIDILSKQFNMSESSFYRNFNKVTSLSPLQYQKRLRLYEAQRLMLAEGKDASSVAYDVGYESPSQFNREYKRMFGEPPITNIKRLKI
jgi:AraC-like DNA-binding protein